MRCSRDRFINQETYLATVCRQCPPKKPCAKEKGDGEYTELTVQRKNGCLRFRCGEKENDVQWHMRFPKG